MDEPDTVPELPCPAPGEPPNDGFSSSFQGFEQLPSYTIPAATPESFICLRGPCRHYWHSVTHADVGNPDGAFEAMGLKAPRQHHHVCRLDDSQLTENCVYDCSQWDPLSPREVKKLGKRREAYYRREQKLVLRVLKDASEGKTSYVD